MKRFGSEHVIHRGPVYRAPQEAVTSAGQQLHPRALGGNGNVEGARLHADVSRVDEASFADQLREKGNNTKTTCPATLEFHAA